MIKVLWIEGKHNLVDLLSKTTIAEDARWSLVNQIFLCQILLMKISLVGA